MTVGRKKILPVLALAIFLLAGCDPVTRHKVLSTLFDGYPSLPPAENYCSDYVAAYVAKAAAAAEGESEQETGIGKKENFSRHLPYAEKKCNDCHDQTKENGLIAPSRELCFICHTGFIKGTQVHGPVAVGECAACHLPHSSKHPSLLKAAQDEICATCHRETRIAAGMHARVEENKLNCVDCHDPHYGDSRYFLK